MCPVPRFQLHMRFCFLAAACARARRVTWRHKLHHSLHIGTLNFVAIQFAVRIGGDMYVHSSKMAGPGWLMTLPVSFTASQLAEMMASRPGPWRRRKMLPLCEWTIIRFSTRPPHNTGMARMHLFGDPSGERTRSILLCLWPGRPGRLCAAPVVARQPIASHAGAARRGRIRSDDARARHDCSAPSSRA